MMIGLFMIRATKVMVIKVLKDVVDGDKFIKICEINEVFYGGTVGMIEIVWAGWLCHRCMTDIF